MTTLDKVEWLRDQKDDGRAFSAAACLAKQDLVSVLHHFGANADLRMSSDRLVCEVMKRL